MSTSAPSLPEIFADAVRGGFQGTLPAPYREPDEASPTPADLIANRLVELGVITLEQMRYAQRIRTKLTSGKTLLKILEELHFVVNEQVREVLRANPMGVPLGALLVELGYLLEADLNLALSLQREKPASRLGEILVANHFVAEEDLIEVLSYQYGFEHFSPEVLPPAPEFLQMAPMNWFRNNCCVPLGRRRGAVMIAFADPLDQPLVDSARRLFGANLMVGIAGREAIQQALDRLETARVRGAPAQVAENVIVQTVNEILHAAIDSNSSDIHIEPMKDRLRIRMRRDGILMLYKDYPPEIMPPLTNRIKIMASADIAEKRRHQDGRISYDHDGSQLDIRVSTYGSIYGETIVLRLLNNRKQLMEIRDVGMAPRILERYLENALDAPSGVVIITGPTGSGKTTTLYASIQYLNNTQNSIITAEDPVEYMIDGISQCSINPKINVTFEDTLKHMVRQDPDIMVIGEIRDLFSAETAIQAALTGHKVLTTFHTEDSIGGLLRLLNMNIEAFLISSTVVSVIAQRLLQRVCPHCAEHEPVTPQQAHRLGYEPREAAGLVFKVGRGCSRCRYRGYSGRIPVFELLVLNEMVKDAIIARKTSYEIRRISMESTGLVTLLEDAIYKAAQGLTSWKEIMRQVPRLSKPRPVNELHKLLGDM